MLDELREKAKQLNSFKLLLGIVNNSTERKNDDGITNADLLIIHEFGSPVRNIPSRPIIKWTIEKANNLINGSWQKCINLFFKNEWTIRDVENELNKLALRIESIARKALRNGSTGFEPLKEETIKRKKSDLILFDTGQLSRSIVCVVVKT